MPARTRAMWRANPGSFRAYAIVTTVALAAGLALLLGPPSRSSGAAYRTINELGGPRWFGVAFLALSAWLVLASRIGPGAIRHALITACAVFVIIAVSFGKSAWYDDHAGLLGPLFCAGLAAWCVSQSVLYRKDRR